MLMKQTNRESKTGQEHEKKTKFLDMIYRQRISRIAIEILDKKGYDVKIKNTTKMKMQSANHLPHNTINLTICIVVPIILIVSYINTTRSELS